MSQVMPEFSSEEQTKLLRIEDGTTWSDDFSGEGYFALLSALKDVHLNVERGLGDYSTRVGRPHAYTEKGSIYFTLANGVIKAEGDAIVPVVIAPPFTVERQIEVIHQLTEQMIEAIIKLKPDFASCVVWRRFPGVERYLRQDGLAFKCSARLVWED